MERAAFAAEAGFDAVLRARAYSGQAVAPVVYRVAEGVKEGVDQERRVGGRGGATATDGRGWM